jgi:hypothetical protein
MAAEQQTCEKPAEILGVVAVRQIYAQLFGEEWTTLQLRETDHRGAPAEAGSPVRRPSLISDEKSIATKGRGTGLLRNRAPALSAAA